MSQYRNTKIEEKRLASKSLRKSFRNEMGFPACHFLFIGRTFIGKVSASLEQYLKGKDTGAVEKEAFRRAQKLYEKGKSAVSALAE